VTRYRCSFFLICLISLTLNSGWTATPSKTDKGLEAAFQRALYSVDAAPGGFVAANPAQHLSIRFTPGEARLEYQQSSAGLRLRGYGSGERLVRPPAAVLTGSGNRIEYHRDGLAEWYLNRPEGVEQGFTLAARPGRAELGERLTIALEVSGGMQPALAPAGDAVLLESDGQALLRYTGLRAWDAAGRELDARLEVRGREVLLTIEDAGAVYPLTVDPTVQQAELTASDGAAGDNFGFSVAVDADTAVIGAYYKAGGQGAVYVFTRNGAVWSQQAKLTANDGQRDLFGTSVAVSGDTAVVGASLKITAGGTSGAAYVFTRSGGIWTQQTLLVSSDAAAADFFGNSVAVNGDTVVVGAYEKAFYQGAAYVFTRSGVAWSQQAKLTAANALPLDEFGYSVAVSGDTAVIGAYSKAGNLGAAYVFARSGTAWSQQTELAANDGGVDEFGYSVAVSGDTAVIGAPQKITAGGTSGAVYVFTRSGSIWTQQTLLVSSDAAAADNFGTSVAVSGDTAVIGAYEKASFQGAAYVFTRSGVAWSQQAKLTASDAATWDEFGYSVAVSGDTAVIGAYDKASAQGAAYVFVLPILTVASAPPGMPFTANGAGCPSGALTAPYTLLAAPTCTITFPSTAVLDSAGDMRYTFRQWGDGDPSNPRAFALFQSATFVAQFSTEYLLNAAASPSSGGQVTGSGWYADSANATVAAIPNAGFLFTGFSGDLSGNAAPQTLWMSGPKTVTGLFIPMPGATLSVLISSKSGPQNARQWTITLTNSGPGVAYSPMIHGLILTQTYGAACVPMRVSPAAFPIGLSSLNSGANTTGSAQFDFSSCPANARFTVVVVFTANSGTSGGATTLANQTM